jgi:nucleoside-diphosphate kinase
LGFTPAYSTPWNSAKIAEQPSQLRIIMERTLVLLKPDCVQRRLVGRVLSRVEDKGLDIVALKLLQVTPELARRHYAEHVHKGWYPNLERFITASPLVAMILAGPEAIRVVREMVGPTNGLKAPPGTVRGDFSTSQQMNLVHASDSPAAAEREIGVFFAPSEICAFTSALLPWQRSPDEA